MTNDYIALPETNCQKPLIFQDFFFFIETSKWLKNASYIGLKINIKIQFFLIHSSLEKYVMTSDQHACQSQHLEKHQKVQKKKLQVFHMHDES